MTHELNAHKTKKTYQLPLRVVEKYFESVIVDWTSLLEDEHEGTSDQEDE